MRMIEAMKGERQMTSLRTLGLSGAGLTLLLLAGAATAAETKSTTQAGQPGAAAWADLVRVVGQLPMPNLSGLIKPEKMGVLTDNQCRVQDNKTKLLSDNQTDVDLLSGLHILSDISVDVHITVTYGDRRPPAEKAKKSKGKKKSPPSRKHGKKTAAKP